MPTERSETDWAREIVGAVEYPTIIELGAHNGDDGRRILNACHPAPRLYLAVEADPRLIPALEKTIGGRPGVVIVQAAIGDRDGQALLYLSDGNSATGYGTGSSSIRRPTKHLETWPDITFSAAVEVPAITLDLLAIQHAIDGVDLIWCDIQGAERDMIAGGQLTLTRTPWLLIEADREAYYEGAATRAEMPGLLPGWELVIEWPEDGNMLFRNAGLKAA
jgi:FkbM family methyltransferase